MRDELEILQKHLGQVGLNIDGANLKHQTQKFSEDITDANDFVGALQILDSSLKKISKLLEDKNYEDVQDKVLIASESLKIVDNCSFLGNALFDNNYNVNVGSKTFAFEIYNPLKILETSDYEGMKAYIIDKREEIASMLSELAVAIATYSPSQSFGGSSYDFMNDLDFTKLFK
ncbi:flagellar FLiS export co-chaperone [Campylobacter sp. CNRCH_2014_0184h]|uniref:flagellar FLiS export co-chaperone n=1 Tax=Campylobacter sp. CNRCH_2014_0184h TaxID=2911602 RepID=UPI0021E655CE|nr:flagellar FLiS export co-chaperone [Campylobacter sp. CNRCH_2014_0184h]MCV3482997.1 flagellar FLiS export co-chaperone [Campylobacter sp. CNRCH_2014_0184h]